MALSDLALSDSEFVYKDRIFITYTTPEIIDEVSNFEFLPNDIIISTYFRSGTTLTQEIVWQIKNRKVVKMNDKVKSTNDRFPFIEFDYERILQCKEGFCEILNSQRNDPYRLIKTHIPYYYIKANVEKVEPKIIVTIRNVKDCLVSNFYFHKNNPHHRFIGTFDEFFDAFLSEKYYYFKDNLEWWSLRNKSNVLILFYEELVLKPFESVEKISTFLGESLSQEELETVVHNTSFPTMYNNPNINLKFNNDFTFLRKGVIGDWKNCLSEEQNNILNGRIQKEFDPVGLQFIYE